MTTINKDIGDELGSIGAVSALTGARIYSVPPETEPGDPYIVFYVNRRRQNDVRDHFDVRIELFAAEVGDLQTMEDAIISALQGATQVGTDNTNYYTVQFLESSGSPIPLKNTKMFVTLMNFAFYKTS